MLLGTVGREMYLETLRELTELSISTRMRLMCHCYSSLSSNVRYRPDMTFERKD